MGELPNQHHNPTESGSPEQEASQPPKLSWRIRRPEYGSRQRPGESAEEFRERVLNEFERNFRKSIGDGYM